MPDIKWQDLFDLETDGFSKKELEEIRFGLEALFARLDADGLRRASIVAAVFESENGKVPIRWTNDPKVLAGYRGRISEVTTDTLNVLVPEKMLMNTQRIKRDKYLAKDGGFEKFNNVRLVIHEALHLIYPEDEENKVVERTNDIVNNIKDSKHYTKERFGYHYRLDGGLNKHDLNYAQMLLKSYKDGFISIKEEFKLNKELVLSCCTSAEISADRRYVTGMLDTDVFESPQDLGKGENFTLSPKGIKVE